MALRIKTSDNYEKIKKQEAIIAEKLVKGYRNNPNLKRVGEKIEWTIDLLKEYKKCSEDPIYFAEKYVKIITKDEGLQPLVLYDYQKEMIQSLKDNRLTIVMTARQAGKSTTVTVFLLWYVLFHSDKTVAILANKGATAREIFSKIRLAYQYLPKWLQQGIVEGGWNKSSMELENNSRILAESSSAENIRGYSINFLFIDEAAFVDNWDEFESSVMPTIVSGKTTKVCLVSTPNGMNHFHDFWIGANKGVNGYYPIKVTWQQVPGRDEEWKENTLRLINFNTQKFAQEQECQFMGSSGTLIAGWKLEIMQEEVVVNSHQSSDSHFLKKYEDPKKGHIYVLIADVSRGKGLDYSAFSVVDISEIPNRVVATYRSNLINTVDYAGVINQIGTMYNEAFILVEINDIGGQIPDILFHEYEYENIIHTETKGRLGKRVTMGSGRNVDRGIRTTSTVKNMGCSMLKMLIEQDKLVVKDPETVKELSTFSMKGKSYEAEPGKHDDMVMGLVLFAWLTMDPFFANMTDQNIIMSLREQTEEQMMDELTPFGVIDTGHSEEETVDLEMPSMFDW